MECATKIDRMFFLYPQAKQTYEDAISEGRTAMLLQEHDDVSDLFTCSIGNLPPKTDATLMFSYVQELSLSPEGGVNFMLPCVFVPRYAPADTPGGKPGSGPGMPLLTVSYPLLFTLHIES